MRPRRSASIRTVHSLVCRRTLPPVRPSRRAVLGATSHVECCRVGADGTTRNPQACGTSQRGTTHLPPEAPPCGGVGRPVIWDEDRSRYHVLDFRLGTQRRWSSLRHRDEVRDRVRRLPVPHASSASVKSSVNLRRSLPEAVAARPTREPLSVEGMLRDLGAWQPQHWADGVGLTGRWIDALFEWMAIRRSPFRAISRDFGLPSQLV